MNYEEEVIHYIVKEGNLSVALEVADILVEWRDRMQRAFWAELQKNLNRRLAQSTHFEAWAVSFNKKGLNSYDKEWFSCRLKSSELVPGQPYFRVTVQQRHAKDDFPLKYGVSRHPQEDAPFDIPEARALKMKLLNDHFTDREPAYLGVKYPDYAITSPEFLERMALEQAAAIDEVAGLIWDLFSQHVDLLTDAHQALARGRAGTSINQ